MSAQELITEHIDLWTSTVKAKNTQGRGSSKKRELYGIRKLRELILELAVRGKLVPQDPSDDSASVLLDRIEVEKKQLIKHNKIKKQKLKPESTDIENPGDFPDSWVIIRLGNISENLDRLRKPISKGDRTKGDYPYYGASGVVDYVADYIFDEPLVLIGEDGAKWSRGDYTAFSVDGKYWVNNHVHAIRPNRNIILDQFLVYQLAQQDLQKYITGITVPKLNQARLSSIVLLIPSLAEQHRIIARADELMALCDQLEQQTESSLDAHNLLVDTLLSTLTDAHDANELSDNWARLADNFDTLITTEYAVEQLKQTILQLAVQGKLVPQDPSDEPASELLKRIAGEKTQLIKDKKIKKQKSLPAIMGEEKPFELPDGWEWCRFDALAQLVTSGSRGWKAFYSNSGSTFIRSQDIKKDKLEFDNRAFVDLPKTTEGVRTKVECNDLLMTITGANVAKVARIEGAPVDSYVSQHVALIRLVEQGLGRFLHIWLTGEHGGRNLLLNSSYGAKPGLNLLNIRELAVPVAPIEEGERIIAKVDELTTLCDQLKAQLNAAQFTQLDLSDAVVEGALTA